MKNISRKSLLFLKKNAPQILSGVASAGVVGTAVLTAKGATKATKLLNEAKIEKGEDLTKMEIIQVAGPAYLPAITLGVITVSSIMGACIINKKRQASLIGGYMMLETTFKQYRNKVDELYGEGSDAEIQEELNDDNKPVDVDTVEKLFYDVRSDQFFKSSLFKVQLAEYHMNRNLMMRDHVYLNEWYDELGIDDVPDGEKLGWTTFMCLEMYWQPWLDFNHEYKKLDDGTEYIAVSFWQEPIDDFEDYL